MSAADQQMAELTRGIEASAARIDEQLKKTLDEWKTARAQVEEAKARFEMYRGVYDGTDPDQKVLELPSVSAAWEGLLLARTKQARAKDAYVRAKHRYDEVMAYMHSWRSS